MAKNQESYIKHQQIVDQTWAHYKVLNSIFNTLRQYELRNAEVTPLVRAAVLELEERRRECANVIQQTMYELQVAIDDLFNKTLEGSSDGSGHTE